MRQFTETLYDAYGQSFSVDKLYFEDKTEYQHLLIFHNAKFGRVMALDGVVQTTEKDEFIYHEMMAHVPILAHGSANNVLIIGGGDGGILREVLKHESVEQVTQVEIDRQVINMCREYIPSHSNGAFDHPKADIVIDDGIRFVRTTERRFDVIISDSTDPIGPGEVLFTEDFYHLCHRCLNPNGILVAQNGVAFMQLNEVKNTFERMSGVFLDNTFYSAAVPTYVGGIMMFAWGTDQVELRRQPLNVIAERFRQVKINTRYYTPEIHQASFALPRYILDAIKK